MTVLDINKPLRWKLTVSALALATSAGACVGQIGGGASDDGSGTTEQSLCAGPIDVGTTPLRRLTREQYNRAASALLRLDTTVGDAFVGDEKLAAFSSNAVAPVTELSVEGYVNAAEELAVAGMANLSAVLSCDPDADGATACARTFVEEFGRRAYRRPLTSEETAGLVGLYELAREDGPFEDGIQLVMEAVLQSPQFLYHVEVGETDWSADLDLADGVVPLTQHEVATRLAFLLWGAPPDEPLLAAADDAALSTVEGLAAQAERMLSDARAANTIASFHRQVLGLEGLTTLDKDAGLFPEFTPELALAMQRETEMFADYVIREGDGRWATLLTADFTMANPALASLYGADAPSGNAHARVALDGAQRAGLLTHAGVLAVQAHPGQTSPVHRGKLIRENLLCEPPPPPPAAVNDTLPEVDPDVPLREQMEQHRADPACAGCHRLMDPIGLGFEAYDPIGRFRTRIGNVAVDDTGELVGTDVDGEFEGAVELAHILSESDDVRACVATQWLRYGLGRLESKEDGCSEQRIFERFSASDFNIRELMIAVAVSDSMRYLRVPTTESE